MSKKRGRESFNRYKILINLLTRIIKIIPYKIRVYVFTRLRMLQGIVGIGLRYIFLKSIAKNIGENVSIHPGVYIFNIDNLDIGNNVSIHPMSYIEAMGGVSIGNDVSIAHSATILSANHVFQNINKPIKDQGLVYHKTIIRDNVWIGAKATILSGVEVNEGTIIAAGAVVTKETLNNSIVGGIPAEIIKIRI